MKNLTQLPGSGKGSKAKNDNTLSRMRGGIRSRIGSMSLKNTSLFGVILALLLTLGVGEMWGAWYVSGDLNSWGTTAMTQSSANTNIYYLKVSGYQNFKIRPNTNNWTGEKNNSNIDNTAGYIISLGGSGNITGGSSGETWYICYNTSTQKVFGVFAMNIAGNNWGSPAIGNWSTSGAEMTYDGASTFSKTVSSVTAAAHEFKVTRCNTISNWNNAVGYSSVNVSCVNGTVADASGNIKFTPSHAGSVIITYNWSTGKVAVQCPYQISYAAGTGATGTVSASSITTYGSTCTLSSSTFSKTGYTQDGWATSDGGDKVYNLGGTYTGGYTDVTLYPRWKANTTTVTLNLNGGTSGATSVTATYDAALPSFTLATKTGSYNLTGYWTESSGGTKVINADGTFAANSGIWNRTDGSTLTLYAQWSSFLTVTYDGNGSTSGTAPTDANEYSSGATVTVKAKPDGLVKTGYTFTGWKAGGITYIAGQTFTITANTTLVAQWSENKYTVTISGGTASSTTAGISTTGTATVSLPAGKKFTGWTLGSGVTLVSGTTSSATITFHASQASSVTAGFADRAGVKMYFAKPTALGWGTLYAYVWQNGGSATNGSYPGVELSTTETINCVTYYVYQYYTEADGIGGAATGNSAWNRIIFGCNDDAKKTGDLTISNGHYYYVNSTTTGKDAAIASAWYIKGTMNSWGETDVMTHACATNTATKDIELSGGTNYSFKVYDEVNNNWWTTGNTDINNSFTATTLSSSGDDMVIKPAVTGDYTFTVTSTNGTPKLAISFPEFYSIVGSFNEWNTEADELGFSGDVGTAVINLSGSTTAYEFKVIDKGAWSGTTSTLNITGTVSNQAISVGSGNNISLNADIYPNGDYTFTYNKSTKKLGVTYPTSYVVNFGKRTGGNTVTAKINNTTAFNSDTKIKAGTSVTFAQTALSGYTFEGWYNNSTGGTRLSTSSSYTTTVDAATTVYSNYTANHYTVSFNVNGGTASTPDSKEVTFGSAYGELPSGMTHASKVFKGWYTLSSGGTLVTASTLVSTAGNHTLYAQYEDIYDVTIQYKCGDVTLRSNSATTASATAMAADISAPEILGYEFSNWTGSNATFGNASSATTTVKASASTTITANYTAIPTVYFKNNLGWEHVYVTFDNTWVSDAPCNNGKPYFEMTQLGTSDIFSCRIPDTYVTSNYASWAWNIAFDNHGFSASENVGTFSGGFNAGEFLGRGDFDPSATMFIPYDGDSETRNGGTYYRTGCWMKYNSTDPGYKLYANSYKTGSGGSAVTGTPVLLKADIAGGFEFKAKVNFQTANYTYGFMLHKEYTKNSDAIWYTNTSDIYASTTTLPWDFTTDGASENGTRCGIHTEATGDYEFTVSFGTGKPMVNVTYPASVGDWRLAYNDRVAWSGSAHAADWYIYSRVIKAEANAEDIVSFYVSKAAGANAHVELQKCTAINALTGVETWTKQGSNLDISSITGTGIYNFKVTQNGSKVATAAYDGSYSGNFYIRTDASDGGWSNYKTSGTNTMTYSEYAEDNSGFTHYFMRYVTKGANIKFCIANDYSPCLTEYCIDDDYTEEWIEANGNVRFMWDVRTNAVSRAYISGSSVVSDRFLVLEGDNRMFDENGNALSISGLNANEMNFTDDQNWIYEATIQAKPGAKALLTAKYNNKIQYFGGSGPTNTDSVLLIGGSDANKYKIRVVYDFKTNRMIKAFMPDGAINTDLEINADLMIIREAQGDAQQVTFGASGKLSEVKTVYGAMKFNKYTVNDKAKEGGHAKLNWSRYKRDLFYISFPFDVKLSDVFGFGTYGKHWIIEYYDGKERAANGFWSDTETFWKFVMPSQRHDFTLKANEGYILALDLDELTESSSVWNNGVEDVYVYFPSNGDIDNIYATEKTVTIDQTGYVCTIGPRPGMSDDRRVKDSYWHMIGAPSFANYGSVLKDGKGGSTIDWSDSDGEIDWTTPSLPYLYEWNSADNTLSVTRTATFTFKAMYSYMVQYAGTSIYWSSVNAVVPSPVAPRKIDNAQADVEFRLELQQGEQNADQTFIRLSSDEHVTTGYDFNYDLSKEFNGGKANIYTMITSVIDNEASLAEAAGNVLPMTEQTTVVPVGVKTTTDGDYTFSIPEGTEGVGVTLLDTETGIRTSLSALDYTVSLEAGTYNDRFVIEISPIQHVATALEPSAVGDQQSDVRKLLIDGLLYIVRDGKMFDARGARVE